MAMRSKKPASGTLTTLVLRDDTHTAVKALCRATRTTMKDWISHAIERELRRAASEAV